MEPNDASKLVLMQFRRRKSRSHEVSTSKLTEFC